MMVDGSIHIGGTVGPVGSCSVREMKVTNERKEPRGRGGKRERRPSSGRSVDDIVRELNDAMQAMNKPIGFSVTTEGPTRLLRMTDTVHGTLLRTFPCDDLLSAEKVRELLGVLVDKNG